MCGFIGVAALQPEASRNWLSVASARISHRGPDGSGEWWSAKGNIGLAHRRLAVIELSEAGAQPMVLKAEDIVFNGEIYNHHEIRSELEAMGVQFCSRSDTEVLLKAYLMWGGIAYRVSMECLHSPSMMAADQKYLLQGTGLVARFYSFKKWPTNLCVRIKGADG